LAIAATISDETWMSAGSEFHTFCEVSSAK